MFLAKKGPCQRNGLQIRLGNYAFRAFVSGATGGYFQPPIFFAMAQKSACDLLSVVSPQSFSTAFFSSGFMAIHAVLKSASDLKVFMPASVKNGDIVAGSSSADVLPAASAEPVIIASAIAPIVSGVHFNFLRLGHSNRAKTRDLEEKTSASELGSRMSLIPFIYRRPSAFSAPNAASRHTHDVGLWPACRSSLRLIDKSPRHGGTKTRAG